MKYAPKDYAKAYLALRQAKGELDPKRFLDVVKKNGDFGRIDKIVAAIEELAIHEQGGHVVNVELARPAESKTVENLKKKFGPKDQVRISINPSLVAGVRVTIDGTSELDMSFRRKVNSLFSFPNT